MVMSASARAEGGALEGLQSVAKVGVCPPGTSAWMPPRVPEQGRVLPLRKAPLGYGSSVSRLASPIPWPW